MTGVLLLCAVAALVGIFAIRAWVRLGQEVQDIWSIAIYSGPSPTQLSARGLTPVMTARDVTDTVARFVADPFLFRSRERWYLFFEVYVESLRRGVISVARSRDGTVWTYDRIVLQESFHLSYPYVFEADGAVFMVPEAAEAGGVRLYRATSFPHVWEFDTEMLHGSFYDSSLVQAGGSWWLFTMDATHSLRLFRADALRGPWSEHPRSPIAARDRRIGRPGGRILLYGDSILRFSQDGEPTYGSSVRAFRVVTLTATEYEEHELPDSPLLQASGTGWNATGMHHIDALLDATSGEWVASVDGNRQRTVWNWRLGLRELQRAAARGSSPSMW